MKWEQLLIETARGTFEIFKTGQGQPIDLVHFSNLLCSI